MTASASTEKGLSLAAAHALFECDIEAGILRWKWRDDRQLNWNKRYAGKVAGRLGNARKQVSVDGKNYYIYHIIWLFAKGVWPSEEIDHRHGVQNGDGIGNLREATSLQNTHNSTVKKSSLTGLKGVYRVKGRKDYYARIRVNGKRRYFGPFCCPAVANLRYQIEADKAFGEFARCFRYSGMTDISGFVQLPSSKLAPSVSVTMCGKKLSAPSNATRARSAIWLLKLAISSRGPRRRQFMRLFASGCC